MSENSTQETIQSTALRLRERYDIFRSSVLIASKMTKALFAGRANDVVFWALVFAEFNDEPLCEELCAASRKFPATLN